VKINFKRMGVLLSALLLQSTATVAQPTTFLGPTAKASYTDTFTDTSAYSIAGEVGVKNYRVSGTLGWQLEAAQRLKITAEYLAQKITYNFFVGDSQQWVNQGALGAQYEYAFLDYPMQPQLDLTGYYSHAPSKSLNTTTGRIAGSKAGGLAPGISIHPWLGGKAGVDLNYDKVSYDYHGTTSKDANGFGGTARFDQTFTQNMGIGLVAGFRQPFNNYQANINWSADNAMGEWIWGLGTEYTVGKNSLPSSYNVVASLNFLTDRDVATSAGTRKNNVKGDYKDEGLPPVNNELKHWVAEPAVRMPQVLAIAEDPVPFGCQLAVPTLLLAIPNTAPFAAPGVIAMAPFFSGGGLTYSLTQVTPFAPAIPATTTTVTINPANGVVSVNYVAGPVVYSGTFTVTATNCAGSVTSNVFTINLG
jgi:hypothetical protein